MVTITPVNEYRTKLDNNLRSLRGKRPNNENLINHFYGLHDALRGYETERNPCDGLSGIALPDKFAQELLTVPYVPPQRVSQECPTPRIISAQKDNSIITQNHEVKWAAYKNHVNCDLACCEWYAENIDEEYHHGNVRGTRGFGNMNAKDIAEHLITCYGKPTNKEIKQRNIELISSARPGTAVATILKDIENTNTALALSGHNYADKHLIDFATCKFSEMPEYKDLMKTINESDPDDVNTWQKLRKVSTEWMTKKLATGEWATISDLGYSNLGNSYN